MARILVIEGTEPHRSSMPDSLRAAGHEVIVTVSPNKALDLAQSVDLVISDWDLADTSGLELCRQLSDPDAPRPVPVMLSATLTSVTDVMAGLVAGAAGYVNFDLPPDVLVERVRQVLITGTVHHGLSSTSKDGKDEITLRVENIGFAMRASREQLLSVLVSTLDDLARANRQHEAELQLRRETEEKLRDSEALYESLVETLPMNLFRKDRNGGVTFANRRYCQLLATDIDTLLGKTDYDLFPRELADKYTADDRRVMQSGEVFECTESHVTPDGDKRYAHVLKTAVYDANGKVIGTQGIFWDVTARRRAEEALEREQFLLNTLMDTVPDNIFFKDLEGRYLRVNRAMAERLGVKDPSEVAGKTGEDYFTPEYAARIRSRDEHVVQTGEAIFGEEEFVRWSDGTDRWVLITRMPLYDANGKINGSFGLSHNITDQKKAQQAMQEARDEAESASNAKSNFLANMSHEIRTPMNAIIGMTELVLDTPLNHSQRDYLTLVQESGEALLGVINDILDFSKIEAGKLELDPRPFQLRENLGDTLKSLSVRSNQGTIELACHIAGDVPEFLIGDAGRLRQIVVNLVGNSIKFTETGEIVLDVSLWDDAVHSPLNGKLIMHASDLALPETEPTDQSVVLHFAVTDTGIGIPTDQLAKIFEAFEQVDTSLTRRFEGTGLGLAITSRLVELMHGQIWVESQLGSGSTFHFTVRLELGPLLNELPQTNTTSLTGRRVLVVDDNATNRRILDEILRNWLVIPTLVESSAAGLLALQEAQAANRPFDLILTDANMPDENGFTFVQKLRARPELVGQVIMMLTSGGRMGDLARCTQLGISQYLLKPIKQSELFDAIVDVLGVREVEDEKSAHGDQLIPHSRSLRVLLAEDSKVNQKLAIAILEKWGHRITVAHNGQEAVQMWEHGDFDVVLMDVQMPLCDGLDATRRIRQREAGSTRHIPIVAMTAHALKGDEERCLASGMDGYITKPIRAPLLFARLSEICESEDCSAPLSSTAALSSNATAASTEADAIVVDRSAIKPSDRAAINDRQTVESADAPHLVDWSAALRIVGNDPALLREIVSAVLVECPDQFQQLEAAIAMGDAPTAHRAAHTILGNLRAIGCERPMRLAVQVEEIAKSGNLAEISEPLEALRALIERVYAELNEFLIKA